MDKDIVHEVLRTQAEQQIKIQSIDSICKEIHNAIIGNGRPGLSTRIALLEQKARFIWLLSVAIFSLVVETVLRFVK